MDEGIGKIAGALYREGNYVKYCGKRGYRKLNMWQGVLCKDAGYALFPAGKLPGYLPYKVLDIAHSYGQ
ncbi:hypothetical protein D7X48_05220 [bacterium D16-50]|nr:hypothetical protein D7X48_05220 [bacterium D16-50]